MSLSTTARGSVVLPMVLVLLAACGASAPVVRPSVTVVLTGDIQRSGPVERALSSAGDLPVTLHLSSPPSTPASPPPLGPDVGVALVEARRAYTERADFDGCLRALDGESLVLGSLADGRRGDAARVLFWRAACHFALGDTAQAARHGREFGVLDLDVPTDAEAASPEVEALLLAARASVEEEARAHMRVQSQASHARVSVDGRMEICPAPCTVEVPVGNHVVRVDADGFAPLWRLVQATAPESSVEIVLVEATPELAAHQWTLRWAASETQDTASSLRLLALTLRSTRLVLLRADRERNGLRLTGALAIGGDAVARARREGIRDGTTEEEVHSLLRDLLERGAVVEPPPPLLEQPLFWVIAGGAALAAAGTTAYLLYDAPIRAEVIF